MSIQQRQDSGLFILIDGIAGSGKTTVIQAMLETIQAKGLRCYRLQDWKSDEGSRPPTFNELPEFDVLLTIEPTKTWIGSALRYEMFHDEAYSGTSHAHAFSLDREIMYRRLILPALQTGKIVIQDRGVSASLVYQPLMPNSLTVSEVANLPGNRLALEHAPDHFIFTDIDPEKVAERINARKDDSKGVYADIDFLRHVDGQFRAPWFRELFETKGTHFHSLNTGGSLEESKANAIRLIQSLLEGHR